MKIRVIEIPNCTWELEGDTFYCTHDETPNIEDGVEDYYDPGDYYGHGQREFKVYVCADPDCEEVLEGSPEEDAYDPDWEYEQYRDQEDERLREY